MKRRSVLFFSSLCAVLLGAASGAPAETRQCDTRQNVLGKLARTYKEAPVAVGVTSTGGLVEVLATGDGDTWTIIVSEPNGLSCLVAAGEGWRKLPLRSVASEPKA